jgi:hypothetical protein
MAGRLPKGGGIKLTEINNVIGHRVDHSKFKGDM